MDKNLGYTMKFEGLSDEKMDVAETINRIRVSISDEIFLIIPYYSSTFKYFLIISSSISSLSKDLIAALALL